jgi:hypothetical protein
MINGIAKRIALYGLMRKAIPKLAPARSPFVNEGFFRDRKRKRRKRALKNILLVCDIIVEDMSRNQIDTEPRREASRPVLWS